MAKRRSARSEVRDMATASNPPLTPREAASSTAAASRPDRRRHPAPRLPALPGAWRRRRPGLRRLARSRRELKTRKSESEV